MDTLVSRISDEVSAKLSAVSLPNLKKGASPLLSKQELATALGVSPASIDRLCRDGKIPYQLVGEARRFDLEEVRASLPKVEVHQSPAKPGPVKVRNEQVTVRYSGSRDDKAPSGR